MTDDDYKPLPSHVDISASYGLSVVWRFCKVRGVNEYRILRDGEDTVGYLDARSGPESRRIISRIEKALNVKPGEKARVDLTDQDFGIVCAEYRLHRVDNRLEDVENPYTG